MLINEENLIPPYDFQMKTILIRSSILRLTFFFFLFCKILFISFESQNLDAGQNGLTNQAVVQNHAGIMSPDEHNEYRQNGFHGNGSNKYSSNGQRSYQKNHSYNNQDSNGNLGASLNEWGRPLERDPELEM